MNLTGRSMEKQFTFLGNVHRAVRFLFNLSLPTKERLVGEEKKSEREQVKETDSTAEVGKGLNTVKPILVYSREEADVWFKIILLKLMKDNSNKKDLIEKFKTAAFSIFENNSTVKQKRMIPTNEHSFMGMCKRLGLYKKVDLFMNGERKPKRQEKTFIERFNEQIDHIKLTRVVEPAVK